MNYDRTDAASPPSDTHQPGWSVDLERRHVNHIQLGAVTATLTIDAGFQNLEWDEVCRAANQSGRDVCGVVGLVTGTSACARCRDLHAVLRPGHAYLPYDSPHDPLAMGLNNVCTDCAHELRGPSDEPNENGPADDWQLRLAAWREEGHANPRITTRPRFARRQVAPNDFVAEARDRGLLALRPGTGRWQPEPPTEWLIAELGGQDGVWEIEYLPKRKRVGRPFELDGHEYGHVGYVRLGGRVVVHLYGRGWHRARVGSDVVDAVQTALAAGMAETPGRTDDRGIWWPSSTWRAACCDGIGAPTPDNPERLRRHCHTKRHIRELAKSQDGEVTELLRSLAHLHNAKTAAPRGEIAAVDRDRGSAADLADLITEDDDW